MSKIKIAIRNNEINQDGKVNAKVRIYHNGKTRYIGTEFYVNADKFDAAKGRVTSKHPSASYFNVEFMKMELDYTERLMKIADRDSYDVSVILRKLSSANDETDYNLYTYIDAVIEEFKTKGSNTHRHYYWAKESLMKYQKGKYIDVRLVDGKFLRGFENFFLKRGKKQNSISIDLRCIRAVYNRMIDDDIINLSYYPFRKFKIKKEETAKRSLTVQQLNILATVELKEPLLFARETFFLSFYLIGMNLYDMYHITPGNIADGRLNYKRAKTGRLYSIKIEPEAEQILTRHMGRYAEKYTTPEQFKKSTNKFLRKIGEKVNLPCDLTSYYARHSWATIAANIAKISKDDIAACLGHGEKTVTDTYIDYDRDRKDDANRKVIDLLKTN